MSQQGTIFLANSALSSDTVNRQQIRQGEMRRKKTIGVERQSALMIKIIII